MGRSRSAWKSSQPPKFGRWSVRRMGRVHGEGFLQGRNAKRDMWWMSLLEEGRMMALITTFEYIRTTIVISRVLRCPSRRNGTNRCTYRRVLSASM